MADKKKQTKAPAKGGQPPQPQQQFNPKAMKAKPKGKGKMEVAPLPAGYLPRMKKLYVERVVPDLKKQFSYGNPMLVPKLDKIVLNVGDGTMHQDARLAESIVDEMSLVSGQHPVLARARMSIANFKLRTGMVVGCRVTLRGWRMYEFLDRLIAIVMPRIRDFRGVSDKSFDGRGNFNFGIKEQIIFPEIDYDKVVKIHGMDINICTTADTDEEAMALLKGFGFPFRKRGVEEGEMVA